MKIIPVIDLKGGVVVHARHGQRDHYQPIRSPLCQSSNTYKVIEAFLRLYNFDTFYIADLDAITLQGNHDALIKDVLTTFPHLQFWIDKGFQRPTQYPKNCLPVLGSECYREEDIFELEAFNKHFILSLDYSKSEALGAKNIFLKPSLWPESIIIMTLNRVGSAQGPDLIKLKEYCEKYPHKNFIAAGGIRNGSDLIALKQIGVQQALIASALHSGEINRETIEKL